MTKPEPVVVAKPAPVVTRFDDDDCVPTFRPPGHPPNCTNAFCYCQRWEPNCGAVSQ